MKGFSVRIARIVIEYLNKRWPYLCREIVVGPDAHIHLNPRRKVRSLAPVEIVTSDGLREAEGHDFLKQI